MAEFVAFLGLEIVAGVGGVLVLYLAWAAPPKLVHPL